MTESLLLNVEKIPALLIPGEVGVFFLVPLQKRSERLGSDRNPLKSVCHSHGNLLICLFIDS